jgi:hypothetical protein
MEFAGRGEKPTNEFIKPSLSEGLITAPMFRKNCFDLRVYPASKIMGGNNRKKKSSGLKLGKEPK